MCSLCNDLKGERAARLVLCIALCFRKWSVCVVTPPYVLKKTLENCLSTRRSLHKHCVYSCENHKPSSFLIFACGSTLPACLGALLLNLLCGPVAPVDSYPPDQQVCTPACCLLCRSAGRACSHAAHRRSRSSSAPPLSLKAQPMPVKSRSKWTRAVPIRKAQSQRS
jgi:hypothetical protein